MSVYVVREGWDSCPVGCGEDIILVKCLPSGRLAGWCWACECSLPIPLPESYKLTDSDMAKESYAPAGITLPEWTDVVAAGLSKDVIRSVSVEQWHGVRSQ